MVQLLEERSCACGSAAVCDEAFHRSLYVKSDVLSSHGSQDSPCTALDNVLGTHDDGEDEHDGARPKQPLVEFRAGGILAAIYENPY